MTYNSGLVQSSLVSGLSPAFPLIQMRTGSGSTNYTVGAGKRWIVVNMSAYSTGSASSVSATIDGVFTQFIYRSTTGATCQNCVIALSEGEYMTIGLAGSFTYYEENA